jgi:hypothetical protein
MEINEHELRRLQEKAKDAEKGYALKSMLRELLGIMKTCFIGAWWLFAIAGTVALYFKPMEPSRLQAVAFATASLIYVLFSKGLYSVKEVEGKHEL